MTIRKAKILDQILTKFTGNVTIKWADLQGGAWNDIATYHACENNINYLVGEQMLKRNNEEHFLCLTDKGFAVMTDPKELGYVTKAHKDLLERYVKILQIIVTIATFAILCYSKFFQ